MGTTVTVALVDERGGSITIGHVGDSRAYRIREESLEQLTDRPLARRRARPQRPADPEQAADHPHRSVITRAVGTEAGRRRRHVHARHSPPAISYLLCSDGLTRRWSATTEILALAEAADASPDAAAAGARRRREPRRRRGQHHRRRFRGLIEGEPRTAPAATPVAPAPRWGRDAVTVPSRCSTTCSAAAQARGAAGAGAPRSSSRSSRRRPRRLVEHRLR